MTGRDWRELPWILWRAPEPPIALPHLVSRLRQVFDAPRRSRAWRGLIGSYLMHFEARGVGRTEIAGLVRGRLAEDASLAAWRAVHRELGLFDEDGPRQVAGAILAAGGEINGIETRANLTGLLADGGFVRAVHMALIAGVRQELDGGNMALSVLSNILGQIVQKQERLRFPEQRVNWANALLLPWRSREPSGEVRDLLLRFFLRVFKDPRLHPQHWQGVEDAGKAVIRRWLARVSLDQFFEIISKAALDHHWKYRRKFWRAYLNKDAIDDAWIALGPDARAYAKPLADAGVAFGGLTRSHSSQSVLILRVGGLVIAEWSHNGKCRAWPAGDPHAPRLMQAYYSKDDFFLPSLHIHGTQQGISHTGSDRGNWQERLAVFIHSRTNIAVSSREYMPR